MERKTILPVKSDVVFRLFFADERNKNCLSNFLKAIIRLPQDDYDDIEILDPHLLREFEGDKLGIVDVKLRTKSAKIIHIEIQLAVTEKLRNRLMYYIAKLITEQIGEGDNYDKINDVVCIAILDKTLLHQSGRYHHRFHMRDVETGIEFTKLAEINTLELSKLPVGTDDTPMYDWARFFAAESEEEYQMAAENNPVIKEAVERLRELSADERVRDMHFRREMMRRDIAAQKDDALRRQALSFARNALRKGISVLDIVDMTGLSRETVEWLKAAEKGDFQPAGGESIG